MSRKTQDIALQLQKMAPSQYEQQTKYLKEIVSLHLQLIHVLCGEDVKPIYHNPPAG